MEARRKEIGHVQELTVGKGHVSSPWLPERERLCSWRWWRRTQGMGWLHGWKWQWAKGWLGLDQGRAEHVGRCDGFHPVPREKRDENEESNYEALGVNTHTKSSMVLLAISQCEGAPTYIGSQSRIIAKTWESGSQPHLTVVGFLIFLIIFNLRGCFSFVYLLGPHPCAVLGCIS